MSAPAPAVPRYGGEGIDALVPRLLARLDEEARQCVLLMIDGLGWDQLGARWPVAPLLASMDRVPITSVVPTTTAVALPSLTTGLPPGRHGLVAQTILLPDDAGGRAFDVLRWTGADRAAEPAPDELQPNPAFGGRSPVVVTKLKHRDAAFTRAHLGQARFRYWKAPSSIPVEVRRAIDDGEPFVYAYYDGLDTVGHHHGLGEHYDAELEAIDRMVSEILDSLPPDSRLVVLGDHGLAEIDHLVAIEPELARRCRFAVGEHRFLWLVARPGEDRTLLDGLRALYEPVAWVLHREEVLAAGWLGPEPAAAAAARLGDVCLVPHAPIGFTLDPGAAGTRPRRCLHGSLTHGEMVVPLLTSQT